MSHLGLRYLNLAFAGQGERCVVVVEGQFAPLEYILTLPVVLKTVDVIGMWCLFQNSSSALGKIIICILSVLCIRCISKKINLRPAASCPPCGPDVAGADNVNSSSGCGRPGPHRPDVVGVRLDAPDATRSCPPQQPCALRTTLPSRYTPCTPRHATPFLTFCDFNLLLPNKPYNPPPTGFPPMLLCSLRIPS